MAIPVETLLASLEEILEDGMSVPLSGGKRMVDVDAARDIIDDIRRNMPREILQAKAISQDHARIISNAKKEAENIVKTAEERARKLLDKNELIRQAQQRARQITSEANQQANRLRTSVTKYCDDLLKNTADQLSKSCVEIKTIRDNLKK